MDFVKAHNFGNDFIILNDHRLNHQKNFNRLAQKLCDPHTGIGANGILILLPPSKTAKADFRMRIINADGSEANMCGNGILCLAKYIFEYGISKKKKINIETLAGIIKLELTTNKTRVTAIKVNMGQPIFKTKDINKPFKVAGKKYHINSLTMGTNHTVIFVDKLDMKEILKSGPVIEKHKLFPQRTNVNFVKIVSSTKIKLMTWERGVGLSMACGTGASASVVAAHLNGKTKKDVTVELDLGNLHITFDNNNTVYMCANSPTIICEGKILI
jgi:diaminopimelate epimerase